MAARTRVRFASHCSAGRFAGRLPDALPSGGPFSENRCGSAMDACSAMKRRGAESNKQIFFMQVSFQTKKLWPRFACSLILLLVRRLISEYSMLWCSGQVILASRTARQAASLLSNLNMEASAVFWLHLRNCLFFIAWLAIFLTIQRPLPTAPRSPSKEQGGGEKMAETYEYTGEGRHGRRLTKSNHPSTL